MVWSHDIMPITAPKETIKEDSNKIYSQDWISYNQAQTQEKILFLELLYELTSQIKQPKRNGVGRPPVDLGEMVYACCLKTYLDFSSRRSESDIKLAQQLGYIDHVPHFNTILRYIRKPEMKQVLTKLIQMSALPLKEVESNFAMDASGFSIVMSFAWNKVNRSSLERRKFKKAHIMVGTKTNVITHIEVTDGYLSDTKMFENLLSNTSRNFQIHELLC